MKYADLKICCSGRQWMVHEVIVCSQSDFFENACKDNFIIRTTYMCKDSISMVNIMQEGKTSTINFPDDDSSLVQDMLYFFYHHDYNYSSDSSELKRHVMLYAIADKYDILGLRQLAQDKFRKAMGFYWQKDEFLAAIRLIYLTTPPQRTGLRVSVLSHLTERQNARFKTMMLMDEFRELMAEVGEFGRDIALRL